MKWDSTLTNWNIQSSMPFIIPFWGLPHVLVATNSGRIGYMSSGG